MASGVPPLCCSRNPSARALHHTNDRATNKPILAIAPTRGRISLADVFSVSLATSFGPTNVVLRIARPMQSKTRMGRTTRASGREGNIASELRSNSGAPTSHQVETVGRLRALLFLRFLRVKNLASIQRRSRQRVFASSLLQRPITVMAMAATESGVGDGGDGERCWRWRRPRTVMAMAAGPRAGGSLSMAIERQGGGVGDVARSRIRPGPGVEAGLRSAQLDSVEPKPGVVRAK